MVDVILRLNAGKTLVDVAHEVNAIFGTAADDPVTAQIECLLPNVNTPITTFEGEDYSRVRMPEEHAAALEQLMAGERPGMEDFDPLAAAAFIVEVQRPGDTDENGDPIPYPRPYFLGQANTLDTDGNILMIDQYDAEGNVVGQIPHLRDVYVGEIA